MLSTTKLLFDNFTQFKTYNCLVENPKSLINKNCSFRRGRNRMEI